MILSIGVDIVQNKRIERAIKKYGSKFLFKFLTPKEMGKLTKNCPSERLSGIFAAKEAVIKAISGLSIKPINFLDIEIIKSNIGAPVAILRRSALLKKINNKKIHLSLSHEKDYSVAIAILENKK